MPTRHTHKSDGLHTRHPLERTHTNTHTGVYITVVKFYELGFVKLRAKTREELVAKRVITRYLRRCKRDEDAGYAQNCGHTDAH